MSPKVSRGGARVTIREVADRAGVALSSVSRVLNGHTAVSESLRQRVLSAVADLQYEPDFTAMSLRRGSTMTVGFLVRDIASPLFADMVQAAGEHLSAHGYSLLLANSDANPERDAALIRVLASRRVDGLLLSLASESHRETLTALRSLRSPIVLIDRKITDLEAGAVLTDHYSGLRKVTKHLAGRGHERIALVTGPQDVLASRERSRGYKAGLRSAGIRFDPQLSRMGSYAVEFGEQQVESLLHLVSRPTAIIAGGSMLAYGILRGIRRAGLQIPSDIALVGCDSWPFPELFDPALTVVSRDAAQIGRTAAKMLLDSLAGADSQIVSLPTKLIVRDTTT